jgi:hypothetical protein
MQMLCSACVVFDLLDFAKLPANSQYFLIKNIKINLILLYASIYHT